jgi:hypothetical protein
MTKPQDPSRYPIQYAELLTRLHTGGVPISIPSTNPAKLRSELYGYFAALRKAGQPEMADGVILTLTPSKPAPGEPGQVNLILREQTPLALEVSAALSALSTHVPEQ